MDIRLEKPADYRKEENGRIILRHWRDSDAAVLYRWASDPDVGPRAGRFSRSGPPYQGPSFADTLDG